MSQKCSDGTSRDAREYARMEVRGEVTYRDSPASKKNLKGILIITVIS